MILDIKYHPRNDNILLIFLNKFGLKYFQ